MPFTISKDDKKVQKQKLLKNSASNFFFNIGIMVLGLISTPIVVNAVGQEKFGLILLSNTIIGYFSIINLSIPSAIIKYIAEFKALNKTKEINHFLNTSLAIFLIIGLIISFCVILFVRLNGLSYFFNISVKNINSAKNLLYISAIWSVFSWPMGILGHSLAGLQEYHRLNIIKATASLISIGGMITTALLDMPLEIIFIANSSGVILQWALHYFYLQQKLPSWKINFFNFDLKILKKFISFSFWLFLVSIAGLLQYQTDRIIIGHFLPVSAITIYFVLIKPFELIKNINGLWNTAVFPAVSEANALGGKKNIDKIIYQGSRYNNAFGASLAILSFFFCVPFIRLWMGSEYLQDVWIAQVASLFQLIWQSNSLLGSVYKGVGKVQKPGLIAITIALFNVIISIILVQKIGLPGVILGTVIAGTLSIPLSYIFIFKDIQINKWRYFTYSFIKAQIPSYCVGMGLCLFTKHIYNINDWVHFLGYLSILFFMLSTLNWIFIVEKRDRQNIANFFLNLNPMRISK